MIQRVMWQNNCLVVVHSVDTARAAIIEAARKWALDQKNPAHQRGKVLRSINDPRCRISRRFQPAVVSHPSVFTQEEHTYCRHHDYPTDWYSLSVSRPEWYSLVEC